jgi:hypothetical protein
LDVQGALQILLAEVRAALDLALLDAASSPAVPDGPVAPAPAGPLQAAREGVEWVLRSLPEDSTDVGVWSEALPRIDAALQSGLDRAFGVIDSWRGVPLTVAASARDAGALIANALGDEPLNPFWLRPEWLGLAPRLQRLRRRRRVLKRRLIDPDSGPQNFDDSEPTD